jgi:hypothetical protein
MPVTSAKRRNVARGYGLTVLVVVVDEVLGVL